MLYKFRSKAAGDVIMLGSNGDQMLRLLGREPAPQGIIEVPHMAAAIAALQAAVQADEAARAEAERDGRSSALKEVALRQRVWPMVDMMTRSAKADEPIVWGV